MKSILGKIIKALFRWCYGGIIASHYTMWDLHGKHSASMTVKPLLVAGKKNIRATI
jgi:hypothetical protein